MSLGAFFQHWRHGGDGDSGIFAAAVVAILFAILAAASFAVDHSLTLSTIPEPPRQSTTTR